MFYDANILFDLISGQVHRNAYNKSPDSSRILNAESLHELAKKLSIPRCVSQRTHDMLEERVAKSSNFVADIVRNLSDGISKKKQGLQGNPSSGFAPFDPQEDIFLIEDNIFDNFRALRRSEEWEKESLRSIEHLLVERIRSYKNGKGIDTGIILNDLTGILIELTKVSEARKQAFFHLKKEIEVLAIEEDPHTRFLIQTKGGVNDPEDVSQLAAAAQHQKINNVWTIFASTDYRDIIAARYELYTVLHLTCCQPLYAVDHLKRLVKSKGIRPDMNKPGYIR